MKFTKNLRGVLQLGGGRGAAIVVAAGLAILDGCGTTKPVASSAEQALPLAHVDARTAGTISGRVQWQGAVPKRVDIDMSANPMCERQHPKPAKSEQTVVNPNNTLRYTFVWIKKGLPKARWEALPEMAKLDQVGCVYTPHVLGVMVGQTLEIANSDPVNHNIHAAGTTNPGWNETEAPRAETKQKQFSEPELLIPVSCGVHPWMKAFVNVAPHPFFAVTDEKGAFILNGVPPGTYTVEAVHEMYGKKEMEVTVGPQERKEVEFSYGG